MTDQTPDYNEFYNEHLVSLYDLCNPIGDDSRFFIEEIEKRNPKTLIDLGCGTGILTCELTKENRTIIGVEPSEKMLEVARNRYNENKITWVPGEITDLKDIKANMVIMTSHVAQFFLKDDHWITTLKKIYDILESEGTLIFDSRNPLVSPFSTWPTPSNHKVVRSAQGEEIHWWANIISYSSREILYELHYLLPHAQRTLVSTNKLIVRSKEEITNSLNEAGFTIETIFGNWDGSPFENNSPEMIFVATRQ